jgi:hypothetical protein
MNRRDRHGMRGLFTMRIYRRGNLVETCRDNNLIVDGARERASGASGVVGCAPAFRVA